MEWQPIETAPKDGTYVLMVKKGLVPAVARWQHDRQIFDFIEEEDMPTGDAWQEYLAMCIEWTPTHWMPLPDPPA